jgi:hypothetical protein
MTSTLTRTPSSPVRRDERRLHLPKRGRRGLLIAHVLSSVAWFGIATFVLFLLLVARSTGDAGYARAIYRTVETSIWLSVPMAAVSAITGSCSASARRGASPGTGGSCSRRSRSYRSSSPTSS